MENKQEEDILPKQIVQEQQPKNRTKLIILIVAIILLFAGTIVAYITGKAKISLNGISSYSSIKQDKAVSYISLNSEKEFLYKTKKQGKEGVLDFIKENPEYKGVKLLPNDFYKNSSLVREKNDSTDKFLKNNNINISNQHFFFNQKIKDIPIYGVNLAVHLRNNNEIYSVSGNIVNDQTVPEQKITDKEVEKIAMQMASKEVNKKSELEIEKSEKNIFNKKALGMSDDPQNYLTQAITISATGNSDPFSKIYFIDLSGGKTVYVENLVPEVLSRRIYDCRSGSCVLKRSEGQLPVGDSNLDSFYDILGDVYNYYLINFNRDSIDGVGGSLAGKLKPPCGNATWDGTYMNICIDAFGKDVIAHEMTHGITQHTASLIYSWQSGTMNESISDIFASNMDDNWTMGEGTGLGIIRSISDPPSIARTTQSGQVVRQADRLFSPEYYCVPRGSACSDQYGNTTNDYCGVHKNSGVLNKAYYLMTDGGSFNGCAISGIGRQKAGAVMYQALTRYLSQSSNFKSMYSFTLQACNDLYGISSDCDSVKNALQATEMDQQPDGDQLGAACPGQTVSYHTPECAGGTNPESSTTTTDPGGSTTTTTIIDSGSTTTTTINPGSVSTTTTTTTIPTDPDEEDTTTTTIPIFYNCVFDPNCALNQGQIQFCPLICTEK